MRLFSSFSEARAYRVVSEAYLDTLKELAVPRFLAQHAWNTIAHAYQDGKRHYHTLVHIAEVLHVARVLTYAEGLGSAAEAHQMITMALVYHDVVYEPGAKDNESRSADWARADLYSFDLPESFVQDVVAAIAATAHEAPVRAREVVLHDAAAIVHDADLAMLAKPWEQFQAAGRKLRREYRHLDDREFMHRRQAFFRQLLQRPHILHTIVGRRFLEERIRANLQRSLKTPQFVEYVCPTCGARQHAREGAPLVCESCDDIMHPAR